MARTSVYSAYEGDIIVDLLQEKMNSKGWDIKIYNNANQCKPFTRTNLDDCYVIGFKESTDNKNEIIENLNSAGKKAISDFFTKGMLGDIRLGVSKDFDAPSWFISEHGPEVWEEIEQSYPAVIVEQYKSSKLYIELDNWRYSEKSGISKDLISDFAKSLDETIGVMIEDDDSGDFIINGKKVWQREVDEF